MQDQVPVHTSRVEGAAAAAIVRHPGLPRFGDARRIRVGVLGGSFNPAHDGHLAVLRAAIRALRLDQVWLLVSPGNPLKARVGMAPLQARLGSARLIAARIGGRRGIATDIERHLGTRFTVDTLRALRRRFPRAQIIWLIGADNLVQLPRWRRWMEIARHAPIAIMPRPGYNERALAGQAARRLRPWRRPARRGAVLGAGAPAWVFLQARQNAQSATALRAKSATPDMTRPDAGDGP